MLTKMVDLFSALSGVTLRFLVTEPRGQLLFVCTTMHLEVK